jgi:hypothetical protein
MKQFSMSIEELSSRIICKPYYLEWKYPSDLGKGRIDNLKEEGAINYNGLTDQQKMILYVYAWNLSDLCPFKKTVMKEFNWTAYKVGKLFKELKDYGLQCVPLFSEETGLLSGKGYLYNFSNHNINN